MLLPLDHVLLDVGRLEVIHQEVIVREEEMGLLPIPRLDDVVVEPIEHMYDFVRYVERYKFN